MEEMFKQQKIVASGLKPDVPYNDHKKGIDDEEASDFHNWGIQCLAQV
jgi:hypothetical protein